METKRLVRLLAIERDVDALRNLQNTLGLSKRIDTQLVTVQCLGQGLEALASGSFDVVVTGLSLPDASGVEIVRQIDRGSPETPVIVLTQDDDEQIALEALRAGAEDFLSKQTLSLITLEHVIPYAIERKRSSVSLKESQRAYTTLLDNLPGMVFRCKNDAHWTMEIVSHRCLELTGYPPEALIDNQEIAYVDLIYPDDQSHVTDVIEAALAEGSGYSVAYRLITASGQVKHVWEQGRGVYSSRGKLLAIEGYIADLTSHWEVQQALGATQQQFQALADSFGDIVFTLDRDQRHTGIYGRWVGDAGLTADHFLGRTAREILGDGAAMPHEAANEAALQGRYILYEWSAPAPDGLHHYETSLSPIYDLENRVVGVAGIGRDITHRKRLEREQQATLNLAAAIRSANTRAELLPLILRETMTALGCSATAIGHFDEAAHALVVERASGLWEPFAGNSMSIEADGFLHYSLKSGQPFQISPDHSATFHSLPEEVRRAGIVYCAPLASQGAAFGLLVAGKETPFTPLDQRIFEAFTDLSANAIHRTALLEETAERLAYMHSLHEIDQTIVGRKNVRAILRKVIDSAMTNLHLDACQVTQVEDGGNRLRILAQHGFLRSARSGHAFDHPQHAGPCPIATHQSMLIPDLSQRADIVRLRRLGEEGFVSYLGIPVNGSHGMKAVLEVFQRSPLRLAPSQVNYLETLAGQVSIALETAALNADLHRKHVELMEAYDSTIEGWSRTLELRDDDTVGHSNRVMETTVRLARALGLPEDEIVHLRRGALLHDIGKIGIPDAILRKETSLTEQEWQVMRTHPVLAYERLKSIKFLEPALSIPLYHHERWDGSGYPMGLKGEAIPLAARIFAVADVWDALTSDRPYRKAWNTQEARGYILSMSGKQFDPRVVEAFLQSVEG